LPVVGDDMTIDVVDGHDSPIGEIIRRDVFKLRANFRVAHVLVFNRKGELLIQRLGSKRQRHPRYWGSSVAGYLFAGETYQEAARRRISQELGAPNAVLTSLGKFSMNDEGCKKFIGLFSTIQEGPFRIDHSHIEAVEFLSLREIHNAKLRFTETFLRVLDFYERMR
jgi:8-oxo-dGTP pyrophosphatase MutT (NUDIX family)